MNFMGALYFVINANICVPVFFLGVGGRVGMCHSCAFELCLLMVPFHWGMMLAVIR